MKLKTLIDNSYWEFVEKQLYSWYYKPEDDLYRYRKIYDELRMMVPKETKTRLYLQLVTRDVVEDKLLDEPYVHIYGMDGTLEKESSDFEFYKFKTPEEKEEFGNREVSYGLEFNSWDKWLGMEVDKETLDNFSNEEIIAHCLWEMTFIDYDQTKIQAVMKKLDETVKEIENMTEEEKKKNLKPLEDLL
jgi:hypothetical protein